MITESESLRTGIEVLLRQAGQCVWADAQVRRATGRDYNFFEIMQVQSSEVWTHTPILADLLNPNGCHGQGDHFLRLFIDGLNNQSSGMMSGTPKEPFAFDAKTAVVVKEKSIGNIGETSGGRIDIYVKDGKGRLLIIENKIYAKDQDKQLERYWNHAREYCGEKHFRIVYLTLDGRAPDGLDDKSEVCSMSYRDDIMAWLLACQQMVMNVPQVRDNLSQYMQIIRKLTNQSNSTTMNQEIANIVLSNEDTLKSYYTLVEAQSEIKGCLIEMLKEQMADVATGISEIKPPFFNEDMSKKESGWYFEADFLSQENIRIGFGFDWADFRKFYFGFASVDANKRIDAGRLGEAFKKEFGHVEDENAWWPASAWGDVIGVASDSTHDVMCSIQSGKLKQIVADVTKRLLKVAHAALGEES